MSARSREGMVAKDPVDAERDSHSVDLRNTQEIIENLVAYPKPRLTLTRHMSPSTDTPMSPDTGVSPAGWRCALARRSAAPQRLEDTGA